MTKIPNWTDEDATAEWDEEQKTKPMGTPLINSLVGDSPLDIELTYVAPPDGQDCYFCGTPHSAEGRAKEGHPLCRLCITKGVPGR